MVDVGVRLPELDDLFTSTSSIMPQKKNPDTAELVRGKTGTVFGSLVAALAIVKALPMSYNRDLQEATPNLWRRISTTRGAVRILAGAVSSAKFNKERLEAASGAGFSTATELADSLVRRTRIPSGMPIRSWGPWPPKREVPTIRDLDEVARGSRGSRPSERGFGKELETALDPKENVAVRSRIGALRRRRRGGWSPIVGRGSRRTAASSRR